jgi:hypothetical protein
VADIAAASDGHFLKRSAGGLVFAGIDDADIPAAIARDSEITAALAAHTAASDPHPTYTTAAELAAAISALGLTSGTYTPTHTSVANVDSTVAYTSQYLRLNSVVAVSGTVEVNTTAAAETQVGISLPIPSAFTTAVECAGTAAAGDIQHSGVIRSDGSNQRAELLFTATDSANHVYRYLFIYLIS